MSVWTSWAESSRRYVSVLFAALLFGSALCAQYPVHVELGDLAPPRGTRLANAQQLGGAAAVDLDGDSSDDFIVALPLTHHAATYAGSVYVLFGPLQESYALDPETLVIGSGVRVDGLESHDQLGRSIGPAGDLNADGIEDLGLATDDRSFIVFGGPHLRGLASLDLAQLDGVLGFELLTDLPGDNGHVHVPVGDVNSDGYEDLFLGYSGKDDPWSHVVLRNDVRCAASGDVDGDGDEDLVAAEGDWNRIVVLINAGDGTFPTRSELTLAANRDVLLSDLDDDGDLDLVAEFEQLQSGVWQGRFAVFLNLGNGNFSAPTDYLVGVVGHGVQVALADLDGDGDQDLAGISYLANSGTPTNPLTEICTYRNDGSGHFTLRRATTFAFHSKDIALIDSDGDTDRDILVTTDNIIPPTSPAVRIFRNDGTGQFVAAGSLPLPGFAESMVVGDLTDDGLDDLCTTSTLFVNSPTGLLPGVPLTYPETITSAGTLADLDGNGTLDLVVSDDSDGIWGHFNPGSGVFDRHLRYRYDAIRGRPRIGDFDGNGVPDLVVEQRSRLSIAFGRGGGRFGGNRSGAAFVVFGRPAIGAGGTLDLDALDGVSGFLIPRAESYASLGHSASPAGDMNMDGVADFVFSAPFTDGDRGDLYVVYGDPALGATGSLEPEFLTPATGIRIHGSTPEGFCRSVLGGLDVDGDGRSDLVCGGPGASVDGLVDAGRVRVIFGSSALVAAGTFDLELLDGVNGYSVTGVEGTFLGGTAISIGDWNSDGKADFAVGATGDDSRGTDKGAVYCLFGDPPRSGSSFSIIALDGRNGFVLHPSLERSFVGSNLAAGDWNADGRTDLYIPSPAHVPGGPDPGSVHLLWKLPNLRGRML